jgi:hypothetical protein
MGPGNAVLDDADKQSIRKWFRELVRSRSEGKPGGAEDEETRLTRDLDLPPGRAADVKGGGEGERDEPREP